MKCMFIVLTEPCAILGGKLGDVSVYAKELTRSRWNAGSLLLSLMLINLTNYTPNLAGCNF